MVLKDSRLVSTAFHWDLQYLAENMGDGKNTVFFSKDNKYT